MSSSTCGHSEMRERRHPAGLEAGCSHDFLGASEAHLRSAHGVRDPDFVGAPVARDQDDDVRVVAHHDHRLDDLAQLATERIGGSTRRRRAVRQLLDPRFDAGRAQDCGDALYRLGPTQPSADLY